MNNPNGESTPQLEVERRRAFRALLRHPLLSATGETAEDYTLVRRHSEWLRNWLLKFPAWSLQLDKQAARLRKIPADLRDETRPAIDRTSGTRFTRRRYALLCLALAALERLDRQTTLGQIAQTIMGLVGGDRDLQAAGIVFDIGNYDQRRDLVHAVRFLMGTGLLRRLDGDDKQFLNKNSSSDVLYDINRPILAAMLNVSRSASAVEAAAANPMEASLRERAARLIDDPIPANEATRGQWIRSRLVRVLLDDPILYFHDLNDEEQAYLERHRGHLLRQICEATGLIAEARAEGIAMVDDGGDLTDLKLPEEGTDGQLSLLLAQWFAERLRTGGGAPIPFSAVEEYVREAGEEPRLAEDALFRLRALRLIQLTDSGIVPLPASGRYAARMPEACAAKKR